MDYFEYRDGALCCEGVSAAELAARFGTPVYVYSRATLLHHYQQLSQAFAPLEALMCYSVKTNSNIHILRLLAQAGAGFDIISGGELFRVLQAGGDPAKVVFAGAGITRLRWVAMGGKSCPFCQEMDGKVVGIEQNFVGPDTVLEAEGKSDMKVYRPASHPPIHEGCVCQIVPE